MGDAWNLEISVHNGLKIRTATVDEKYQHANKINTNSLTTGKYYRLLQT